MTPTVFYKVSPADLRALLPIAATDEVRYSLCGVHIHSGAECVQLIATNGRMLAQYNCGWKAPDGEKRDFTIPRGLIKLIPKWKTCDIAFDGESITISNGDVSISTRTRIGKFPEWKTVIPVEIPKDFPADAVGVHAEQLFCLLKLASTLSKSGRVRISGKGGMSGVEPIYIQAPDITCVLMTSRI